MKKIMVLMLLGIFVGGCNLLEYPFYVLFANQSKTIKAEYTDLQGKKIAIIIATGPAIDFDYPNARTNVGLATAQAISQHVKGVKFVEQDKIDQFQIENLDWAAMPKSEIAARFQADRVLYLDLYQYTMYEQSSMLLLRGQINASVSIYETDGYKPNEPVYTTEIGVVYPEHRPVPQSDTAFQQVQFTTISNFAQELARKFYKHKVKDI